MYKYGLRQIWGVKLIIPEKSGRAPLGNGKFTRYVGYDNRAEFTNLIKKMYCEAAAKGVVFTNPIENPSIAETNLLKSIIDTTRKIASPADISEDVGKLIAAGKLNVNPDDFSDKLYRVLRVVEASAPSKTIFMNGYIKLLCWCIRSYRPSIERVLYIGDITKYEVYYLYLLSMLGANVVYVSFADTAYQHIDNADRFSTAIKGSFSAPISFDFSGVDIHKLEKLRKLNDSFTDKIKKTVQLITTTAESFPSDLLMSGNDRLHSREIHFDLMGLVPVFNFALIGYNDMDIYKNMLYKLRCNIEKTGRPLVVNQRTIPNPTPEEARLFASDNEGGITDIINNIALKVNIQTDERRTTLARYAFVTILNSIDADNPIMIYNLAVKLVVWLNRVVVLQREKYVSDNIPVYIYFGSITPNELIFLHFLSLAGYDVIYISPSKLVIETIKRANYKNRMSIFELPNTHTAPMEFPQSEVRVKMATVAYNAERELDTMMYSGNDIFRDYQFPSCRSLTLKTTFDEIEILWKNEAKYRSGFEVNDNIVTVPNVFAKISGVKDGNIDALWTYVCKRITEDTVIKIKTPAVDTSTTKDLSMYRPFYDKNGIRIQDLKKSPLNKYSYLSDEKQEFIFSKMQEAVDSGFLTIPFPLQIELIISVGMSFEKNIVRMIQRFDFTKEIPKVIVIDTIEATMTMPECIQLVLFNLMGFDILVVTPTGYRNIEAWIDKSAYELYTMNDFVYETRVPKLKAIPEDTEGLFDKLFKKGRK